MFTCGASEVTDLLRRWLVGELAVGAACGKGNAEDSLICISFGLCGHWMFKNGASEVADLLRRWLVGELAVGV